MGLRIRPRLRKAALALAVLPLALVAAGPAGSNDTTAVLGAGGLELVYNSAIEIVAEDLYVGINEVRVAYRFRNVTKAPVTVTVAFPLPALKGADLLDTVVDVANLDAENYVDFRLWVDGQELTPSVYNRVSALGVDRTQMLRATGLPLSPLSYRGAEMMVGLPPATLAELARAGLIIREEWGTIAAWTLETTFYWEQTFPVGRDVVIEHTYQPVVGYSFFGDFALDDPVYRERYCMDEAFIAAARRMMTRDANFPMLNERRIQYILTTANHWAAPIGEFTLTVDKGSPNALVSFCGEGVTRTSPTTFVDTETNFVAVRELDILIVEPMQ